MDRINYTGIHSKTLVYALLAVSPVIFSPPASAGNLDGQDFDNDVKNLMADAVQTVCGKFVANNSADNPVALSDNQTQLFRRCRQMVHSANDLAGNGATADSLDLTKAELGDAMKALADEEVGVQGDWATRSSNQQLTNLQTRLAALHAGSTGLSFNGLNLDAGGQTVALNDRLLSGTGGNAGNGNGKLGVFVTGQIATGERDETALQTGYDLDSIGITAGLDYRVTPQAVVGAAFGWTDTEAEYTDNNGKQDIDGLDLTLYGAYTIDALYFDAAISFGQHDYESQRRVAYAGGEVDTVPTATTEGDLLNGYLAAGYQVAQNQWLVSTYAQLHYTDIDIDAFEEFGGTDQSINMSVAEQNIESLQTVLGTQVEINISASWGVLIPYVKADWHHEFEDESRTTSYQYVYDPFDTTYTLNTDEPDSDYFVVGLGGSAVFAQGQIFIDYATPLALSDVTNHVVSLGCRLEF
ncbi:MAG: autotransporter outer membrane beta-barrel domain-containing protein [Pseudomonadales bacterium]|nr:autotransporter outer membrane beta-barrel domain-containing protein [Pseudomonadales bacterium]